MPLHLWQRPVPVQKGHTSALSSIVAVESSDADRSNLSGRIDCGWSGGPEQASSTLSLPQRFYAFWSLRVTVDARLVRDLFLALRFARYVSPLTITVYTYSSDQEMWEKVLRLSC